ncbi:MAG TPA: Ppx/GppA phosphatase family protein [Bryobacteraceae bacterium]|nr:Ppx/GppA phosphatase family protein [Bryobacteraceae bacterium]
MPRYAAIDIGSNSVRMLAAELAPGAPTRILAAERQVTRLGEGVFRNGFLTSEAMDFACATLTSMARIYQQLDVVGVRAVATSAVRDARNQVEFLQRASDAIGAPVELISGQEEARLIHLGVQARWPHPKQRVLIIDIGGGSAELILSEQGRMTAAFSRPLGAVRLTEAFLKHDPPEPAELHRLDEYIEEKLAGPIQRIGTGPWNRAIATSATASAVVCAVNRIPRSRRDSADRLRATVPQVRKFFDAVSRRDLNARRKLTGIGPRRAEIIIPGAAVLMRAMRDFHLPPIWYSDAGVRDGVIADLAARRVGEELTQLSREQRRVVEDTARHYGVQVKHARKVASLAHTLFDSFQSLHELPPNTGRLLEAAAYLHDTGHYVSDTRHHKHSYYLVANSDMPGFTDRERLLIANLCRYHRRALPAPVHDNLQLLSAEERRTVDLLHPLLRLADSLDRSHDQRVENLECQIHDNTVVLHIRSAADTDLEEWAGEKAAEIFHKVYQRPLSLVRVRS